LEGFGLYKAFILISSTCRTSDAWFFIRIVQDSKLVFKRIKKKLTDIGFWFGFSFGNQIETKIYNSGFSDMDWIDIIYQSTSATKLIQQRRLHNGGFALLRPYGNYRCQRT